MNRLLVLVVVSLVAVLGASAQATVSVASLAGKTGTRDLKVGGDGVVWGPGSQILFVTQLTHSIPRSVYSYDLATGKLARVTNNGWEGSASWMPGFGGFFFSSYGTAKNAYDFSLWYLKLGGKPQLWYNGAESVQYPKVSPDGKWVVAATGAGLILLGADKPGAPRPLTHEGTEWDSPQEWSADGSSVLFIRTTGYHDEDEMQVARVDVASGKITVLAHVLRSGPYYQNAHVGPDGKLYVSIGDEIRSLDADAKLLVRDSRDAWGIDDFAFSADGTALIYERHNQGEDNILVLKALAK